MTPSISGLVGELVGVGIVKVVEMSTQCVKKSNNVKFLYHTSGSVCLPGSS